MRHLLSYARSLVDCRHRAAIFLEPAFVCTRCGAHRFDTTEPWILPDDVRGLADELSAPSDPQLASVHHYTLEVLRDFLTHADSPALRSDTHFAMLHRHIFSVLTDLLHHADARALRKVLRSLTRAAATALAGPLDPESRPAP